MAKLLRGSWTDNALKNALSVVGLTLLLFLALFSLTTARAQTPDKSLRKVVQRTKPDYPKSLKDAHIGGLVRLNVTVLANGSVAKVEILGGNPIFVESASKAVLKWKFVPATAQTKEEVQVQFNP
jgi:TonB family protein